MKKVVQLLIFVCLVLGIGFVIRAWYDQQAWEKFQKEYEKADGIIVKNMVDPERYFYPVIRFKTLDNQWVKYTLPKRRKEKYTEGDTLQIYYDLVNPEDLALAEDKKPAVKAYSILGAVLLVAGSGLLVSLIMGTRQKGTLKERGRKVSATITSIEEKKSAIKSVYVIHCEWAAPFAPAASPSAVQHFQSNYILADPQPYLQGDQVTVYFDYNDPTKYWVDLSFLPDDIYLS